MMISLINGFFTEHLKFIYSDKSVLSAIPREQLKAHDVDSCTHRSNSNMLTGLTSLKIPVGGFFIYTFSWTSVKCFLLFLRVIIPRHLDG